MLLACPFQSCMNIVWDYFLLIKTKYCRKTSIFLFVILLGAKKEQNKSFFCKKGEQMLLICSNFAPGSPPVMLEGSIIVLNNVDQSIKLLFLMKWAIKLSKNKSFSDFFPYPNTIQSLLLLLLAYCPENNFTNLSVIWESSTIIWLDKKCRWYPVTE